MKRHEPTEQVSVVLTKKVLARAAKVAARLQPLSVTRAEVLRMAIEQGLAAVEEMSRRVAI